MAVNSTRGLGWCWFPVAAVCERRIHSAVGDRRYSASLPSPFPAFSPRNFALVVMSSEVETSLIFGLARNVE